MARLQRLEAAGWQPTAMIRVRWQLLDAAGWEPEAQNRGGLHLLAAAQVGNLQQ